MRSSLLLAAALALAACQLPPKTPTESTAADAAKLEAPAEASSAAAPAEQGSSLCAAYQRQLADSRASLARAPRDASLAQDVATFQAVIADACN
ncbi:MAG TPA: hypothetical protein VF746_09515 [Longimicrobium sp.]|jgi:flagellar basal body L-ring protein FlgH